jgi:hypothetical protein
VVSGNGASLRNIDMDLSPQVAEHRISAMFAFAATQYDDPDLPPISRRGCMIRFGGITAVCAAALPFPNLWPPAVAGCTTALIKTYCECLPLLGFDPCN